MTRFWGSVVVAMCLALFGPAGCDDEPVASGDCDAVDCSGHGQCAVAAGEPLCICDVGYHTVDLTCVQNVAGEECSGVTCSDHGTCFVATGDPPYPVCVCDSAYRSQGNTNCVIESVSSGLTCGAGTHEQAGQCVPNAPSDAACGDVTCSNHGSCAVMGALTPVCECDAGYVPFDDDSRDFTGPLLCVAERCRSRADCTGTDVCSHDTGNCEPASGPACGLPEVGGGSEVKGAACHMDNLKCAADLTCVGDVRLYDPATEGYGTPTDSRAFNGRCLEACDPCATTSSCPAGEDCILLPGGGGFCSTGLLGPGEPCLDIDDPCVAGTNCRRTLGCEPYCKPDNAEFGALRTIWPDTGSRSVDCAEGQPCVQASVSEGGNFFACRPKRLVGPGQPCGDGRVCEYPMICRQIAANVPLTCSLNNPLCGADNPCPDGIECFNGFCIKEHALLFGYRCFADRNCESWLVCRSDGTTDKCLPPL